MVSWLLLHIKSKVITGIDEINQGVCVYASCRCFFDTLLDYAVHSRDPHLFDGGVPGPVCQPGPRVRVESYPGPAR